MTTEELLAECERIRPEMDWERVAEGPVVRGRRGAVSVLIVPTGDGFFASVDSIGRTGATIEAAMSKISMGIADELSTLEPRMGRCRAVLAALAPPIPPDRCAACGWPIGTCVRGDCSYRGMDRGPFNPLDPKRYALEQEAFYKMAAGGGM